MMVVNHKIAVVSYLNAIPFIYGIKHEGNFDAELQLATPAACVELFANSEVDIALVPSAAVPLLKGAEVVTDYCIGAVSDVRTVVVLSNCPIGEVRRLWLDSHSRTSVQLCGYLAKNVWKIEPEWLDLTNYDNLETKLLPTDGVLLIGDKVFGYEGRFKYSYDLAAEWIRATRLPFCFAVWVARKGTPYALTDALERALTYGVEHTYEAIIENGFADVEMAYSYLTSNIDYIFDNEKHKALQKFWDSGIKVSPRVNPG